MEMSSQNCWDCPVPLWSILLQFALLYLAGATGAWMMRRRGSGVRELGIVLVTLTILWAAVITRAVPRWGILRNVARFDLFTQRTAYMIFAILDVMLIGVIVVVRQLAPAAPENQPSRREPPH